MCIQKVDVKICNTALWLYFFLPGCTNTFEDIVVNIGDFCQLFASCTAVVHYLVLVEMNHLR